MKEYIRKLPVIGPLTKSIYHNLTSRLKPFRGSKQYWIERYKSGGNSGAGSYGKLAEFKAEVLNDFVRGNAIETIIEYGCGDGNQLKLSSYPFYIGFDVSLAAISRCQDIFCEDKTKTFKLMDEYRGETAQLTLSLDVIYHLIEDDVFFEYMERLFDSSKTFVIIYSSNTDGQHSAGRPQADHVRSRKFSSWIEENRPQWRLHQYIPNRYPLKANPDGGSWADFYIYKKTG